MHWHMLLTKYVYMHVYIHVSYRIVYMYRIEVYCTVDCAQYRYKIVHQDITSH